LRVGGVDDAGGGERDGAVVEDVGHGGDDVGGPLCGVVAEQHASVGEADYARPSTTANQREDAVASGCLLPRWAVGCGGAGLSGPAAEVGDLLGRAGVEVGQQTGQAVRERPGVRVRADDGEVVSPGGGDLQRSAPGVGGV
jgi:hypothetical protein